jgi:photosystem II stability/assembly factor-like uncharacterized protein
MLLAILLLSAGELKAETQPVATQADFRGLSVVSDTVAWASGAKGTVCRTTDAGKTWQVIQVPEAEKLDFRDIEAFSDRMAYALSIGPGDSSRIYKTTDGGGTWKCQWINQDKDAFYDAIAFWDLQHGIALSDPVGGYYQLLVTSDGGTNWTPLKPQLMPRVQEGEGAFAASGTCLITRGKKDVFFVTGGAATARVFHSSDRGQTWTATRIDIIAGKASAGAFSIAFSDDLNGFVVGGIYDQPSDMERTGVVTHDGGKTWELCKQPMHFLSAVAHGGGHWVMAGTNGMYHSSDGERWTVINRLNYNAARLNSNGNGWAVGPKGLIVRLRKAEK